MRTPRFPAAGAPPAFVGFGSMAPAEGEWLTEVVVATVKQARVRAVVQTGWAGLAPFGDDMLLVGDVPHDCTSSASRQRLCRSAT